MTQLSKLETYKQKMADRGVGNAEAFPPAWRILWRFGLEIPPPPFLGFAPLAIFTGLTFGLSFGLLLFLAGRVGIIDISAKETLHSALIAAPLFGLFMAAYYRHLGRKYGLGSWSDFPGAGERT